MIKKIIQNTCILSALMVLSVFGISIIWAGFTAEIKLVFQLFGLALILVIVNEVFDRITELTLLFNFLAKYLLASGLVVLFGFIVGWFQRSNFWMVFLYVAIVFAGAYFADYFMICNDVEYINRKLKEREKY